MTGVFPSVPRYNGCAPLLHPSSCMLVNHGPSQQSFKEEYKPWKWGATAKYYASHTKTMLPTRKSAAKIQQAIGPNVYMIKLQYIIEKPCYQRRSPCQDPAGNRTTRRPPDHRKETQTAVVWSCLPFIRFGQNHLTRHSDRGEKTRQTEEEVGRLHQGMRQAWSSPSPRGQWRTGKTGGNWLRNHLWCPNDPLG